MPAPIAVIAGSLGKGLLKGAASSAAGGAMSMAGNAITGKGKDKSIKEDSRKKILGERSSAGGGGAIVRTGGSAIVARPSASPLASAPKSEVVVAKKSGGKSGSIISSLINIESSLVQLIKIEKEEKNTIKSKLLSAAKERERAKRKEEEEKQEEKKSLSRGSKSKKENPVVKGAKKAVKGIWDLISGFVKDFILYKILDWFGDPKNKKNVQRIVEFFQGVISFLGGVFDYLISQSGNLMSIAINSFKIFKAFLQPIIDLFTLKWLTNPEEFVQNILNIPKVLFEAVPELFKSLINFITGGLFDNLGKFIGDIISSLNPLKLLGIGGDDNETQSETVESPPTQSSSPANTQQKEEGDGGNMMSMLNPMNWFGGEKNKTIDGVDTSSLPKLKDGGIVSPTESEKPSPSGGSKSSVEVTPLEKLIDVLGISSSLMKAMKPFMDTLVAPFKIIGTAIVGLILKVVSKIPFVGNIIEPIIKMSAESFGVPTSVINQLSAGTPRDKELKEVDKESVLEKFADSIKDVRESVDSAIQGGGGNIFESFLGGAGQVLGGIGDFFGSIFTPPAKAASSPMRSPMGSTGGGSPTPMQSFASHADAGQAGVSQYKNTETGKMYQKTSGDEGGWSEIKPGTGMATFGETDGGSGRLVNAAGYVHGHFQTNTGTRQDVINDTSQMVRAMLNTGLTDISIADGTTFTPSMSDTEIKGLVEKGLGLHSHSGDGRSVDIFVPKGTPVPFPLTDVRTAGGGEGRSGIVPGSGHTWVGHLTPDSQSGSKNVAANISQEPDTSGAIMVAPAQITKTQPSSNTGNQMQSAQQESLQLQASSRNASATPTIVDMGTGKDQSTFTDETSTGGGLGSTLPSTGLWSVFKTNL